MRCLLVQVALECSGPVGPLEDGLDARLLGTGDGPPTSMRDENAGVGSSLCTEPTDVDP